MMRSEKGPAGALFIDDDGSGPGVPVVFVHSFAGDTTHWTAQLAHVRATRRAVALDWRGHGRSDAPPDGDYSIDAIASDIGAALDDLNLPRVVLVGHSTGAAAALAYAGRSPQRVAALMLVGAPGKVPPEAAQQAKVQLEQDYESTLDAYFAPLLRNATPEVAQRLTQAMRRMPRAATLGVFDALAEFDPHRALAAYRGKTLLITSPVDDGPGALHKVATHLAHRTLPGTSHWMQLDAPDRFNALLYDFLSDVR
jgi:pimeloyl-ACP methyl ester carboxylesterase